MTKRTLADVDRQGIVQVANGQVELVSDEVLLPIELDGKTRLMRVQLLPSFLVALALELDFLRFFKLQVDFADRRRSFKESPYRVSDFLVKSWIAHVIDVGNHLAIKKRHYLVSPKVMIDLFKGFLQIS